MLICYRCSGSLENNWSKTLKARKLKLCKICEYSQKREEKRIARLKLRLETIRAYGGSCAFCKETIPLFLTLDHADNNGRFEKQKGTMFYSKLKRLGFPKEGLQLLCHNCNAKKEYCLLRKGKESRASVPAIHKQAYYYISPEDDKALWIEAKELYEKIKKHNVG